MKRAIAGALLPPSFNVDVNNLRHHEVVFLFNIYLWKGRDASMDDSASFYALHTLLFNKLFTMHYWSRSSCYLSSVHDRRDMYSAIFGTTLTEEVYILTLKGLLGHLGHFDAFILRLVDNLLNNKIIIPLNLAEYRLILANSSITAGHYGLFD